jgi:hypothetical protein
MKMTLDADHGNLLVVEHWTANNPEAALLNLHKMLHAAQVIWPRQLKRYCLMENDHASREVHQESGHGQTQADVEPR